MKMSVNAALRQGTVRSGIDDDDDEDDQDDGSSGDHEDDLNV